MLLQAITIEDQRYEQRAGSVDFIKRYIFPGSCIPSIAALLGRPRRAPAICALSHLEDIGPHYALTLAAWRERFIAQLRAGARAGFRRALHPHVGVLPRATARAASASARSAWCICCWPSRVIVCGPDGRVGA